MPEKGASCMETEQLREAAAHDIRYWLIYHEMKCPNCGVEINKMHPMANIYPHWAEQCVPKIVEFARRIAAAAGEFILAELRRKIEELPTLYKPDWEYIRKSDVLKVLADPMPTDQSFARRSDAAAERGK